MEKNWEEFWNTGKVSDYLSYCKERKQEEDRQKEEACYGTIRCIDGDGTDFDARFRL